MRYTLANSFFIRHGENTDWSATIWCLRTNSKLLLSINIISSYLSDLSNVPDLILLRIIVHVTYFSSVFAVLNCQTRKVAFIVSNLKPSFAHFKETSLQSPSKNNKRSVPLGMWSKWPAWYRHLYKDGSSTLVLRNLQVTDSSLTSKFHRLYTLFLLLKGSWMKHINKADC